MGIISRSALILPLLATGLSSEPTPAPAQPTWEEAGEDLFSLVEESLAVDGRRRVAYVFGGYGSPTPAPGDSRLYSCDVDAPVLAWTLASASGGPPPRSLPHLFFDHRRDRLLVLGGIARSNPPAPRHDVWSWDPIGGAWSALGTSDGGPDTLWGRNPLVHDTRRDRLLYVDLGNFPANVWALDLASPAPAWVAVSTTGSPGVMEFAGAAYDSLGDRLFVYGDAQPGPVTDAELWQLPLETGPWVKRFSTDHFTLARNPGMFVDADSNRLVVAMPNGSAPVQVATYDLATLSPWVPMGSGAPTLPTSPPSPTGWPDSYAWAHDPVSQELVTESSHRSAVLYRFAIVPQPQWATNRTERPHESSDQWSAIDAVGRFWYVGTGTTVHRYRLDEPGGWERVVPLGGPPPFVRNNAAAWDSVGRRIVLCGGEDAEGAPSTATWALELDPPLRWAEIATEQPGPEYDRAGAVMDQSQRFLYLKNDRLWRLDLKEVPARWTVLLTHLPDGASRSMGLDTAAGRLLCLSYDYSVIDLTAEPCSLVSGTYLYTLGAPNGYGDASAGAYDSRRRQLVMHGGFVGAVRTTRTLALRAAPVLVDLQVSSATLTSAGRATAAYDPVRDRVLLLNGIDLFPTRAAHGLWSLQFDETTPARIDLVEATPAGSAIVVRFAGAEFEGTLQVERSEAGLDAWIPLGDAREIAPGRFELEDRSVVPGQAYRYRGRYFADGLERLTSESAALRVPGAGRASLALRSRDGSVVRGSEFAFACRLGATGTATLELVDVRGRIVARADLGDADDAEVEVPLSAPGAGPGLYFARLRQGEDAVVLKLIRL